MIALSLPTRERGLKCSKRIWVIEFNEVAPHAGAWIEIAFVVSYLDEEEVAPHAGAWIEINGFSLAFAPDKSLPTRERGLKSSPSAASGGREGVAPHAGAWIEISFLRALCTLTPVAPHAGAWIEMVNARLMLAPKPCRSPRGSVD